MNSTSPSLSAAANAPRLHRAPLAVLTLPAILAGCTVGPDFQSPQTTPPQAWSGLDRGESGRPIGLLPTADAADVSAWWAGFNDPLLTSLVDRAAAHNLTLAQAQSRIRQARAAREVAASGLFPSVDASASASRARSAGGTSNQFRAGFDASWEMDVFGGVRRTVEAADADLESLVYDHLTVLVSLTAEVAATYFDLRGSQRQLAIARENMASQQKTLALTQKRFAAGFVSALDVANASAIVTQTESQIPAYDAQIRAAMYSLGVLLGREPAALVAELSADAPFPLIPTSVPIGLPSDLLLRRPDLRRAQADLHAATARVGVAVADQYPRFFISGSLGTQGDKASSLGTLADRFWSIGPSVSVPVFTAGRVQGNIEQARAVAEQATLSYRQSVLVALQDVETALVNFTREQQRREALSDAADANRRAVDLSLKLYNAGRTDFLNVLSAQRQLYASEALLTASRTTIAVDLIALYKALGGGWDPAAAGPGVTSP